VSRRCRRSSNTSRASKHDIVLNAVSESTFPTQIDLQWTAGTGLQGLGRELISVTSAAGGGASLAVWSDLITLDLPYPSTSLVLTFERRRIEHIHIHVPAGAATAPAWLGSEDSLPLGHLHVRALLGRLACMALSLCRSAQGVCVLPPRGEGKEIPKSLIGRFDVRPINDIKRARMARTFSFLNRCRCCGLRPSPSSKHGHVVPSHLLVSTLPAPSNCRLRLLSHGTKTLPLSVASQSDSSPTFPFVGNKR